MKRRVLIDVALLVGFALCGTRTFAAETFHLRGADLVIQITPSVPGGHLVLSLGPVGDLTWRTHAAPLDVSARFLIRPTALDLPDAKELRDLRYAYLLRKIGWLLLTGALAGVLLSRAPPRARWKPMLLGAGALTTAAALTTVAAVLTFNAAALRDPKYRGPISDAPRVLELLKEVQRDWSDVRRNINDAVAGLERLHDQLIAEAPASPADTVRFLLISDIHNNPIGLLIAQQLVKRFDVDGVLNAGDLTDRGTAIEGELFARFSNLGVPQVVTPGNHEDTETIVRIERIPDTTVLLGGLTDTATIAGVTILGDADPNASSIGDDPFSASARSAMPQLCEALRVRYAKVHPQILMVHDPQQGECAAREAQELGAPLVFAWGHTHRQAYEVRGSVIGVSDGTSGAAGFKTGTVRPYGFALVEMDAQTKRATSVCLFSFDDPSTVRETTCHIVASENGAPTSQGVR